MTEVCGISERRDTEKLLFLPRLVQKGISQTSQGRLTRWVYTLAMGARNLASRGGTGREIIKAVRERHHRLSGNSKKGSDSGMPCTPAILQVAATGKVEAAADKAYVGESTDEAVEAATRSAVGGWRENRRQ